MKLSFFKKLLNKSTAVVLFTAASLPAFAMDAEVDLVVSVFNNRSKWGAAENAHLFDDQKKCYNNKFDDAQKMGHSQLARFYSEKVVRIDEAKVLDDFLYFKRTGPLPESNQRELKTILTNLNTINQKISAEEQKLGISFPRVSLLDGTINQPQPTSIPVFQGQRPEPLPPQVNVVQARDPVVSVFDNQQKWGENARLFDDQKTRYNNKFDDAQKKGHHQLARFYSEKVVRIDEAKVLDNFLHFKRTGPLPESNQRELKTILTNLNTINQKISAEEQKLGISASFQISHLAGTIDQPQPSGSNMSVVLPQEQKIEDVRNQPQPNHIPIVEIQEARFVNDAREQTRERIRVNFGNAETVLCKYKTIANGDCGLSAIGVSREDARALLSNRRASLPARIVITDVNEAIHTLATEGESLTPETLALIGYSHNIPFKVHVWQNIFDTYINQTENVNTYLNINGVDKHILFDGEGHFDLLVPENNLAARTKAKDRENYLDAANAIIQELWGRDNEGIKTNQNVLEQFRDVYQR